MAIFSNRSRPVHLGPHRMERLARAELDEVDEPEARQPLPSPRDVVDEVALEYLRLFDDHRAGEPSSSKAPLSPDPSARANELKAAAHFLDADVAGIARHGSRAFALVLLVKNVPFEGSSARLRAACRAASIAGVLASYLRLLGHEATAHSESASDAGVSLARLAVEAGVALAHDGRLTNPFLGDAFALAAVTTELELPCDRPLAPTPTRRRVPKRARSADGPFPTSWIRRVDAPTTLILEDEVPRVPLRAQFFHRARRGDLGDRAMRESHRFSMKHPLAQAMRPVFRAMVPLQVGEPARTTRDGTEDPKANARYVKSLAYALGASAVGVCEAKRYAWYSHDVDGVPIEPYHRYAIVVLIDQGHDTMEASSGDDWMSGVQSMRAYFRGADVVGQLAGVIRKLGHPARAHTNIDSHVLHIPLILWAGLGELSRIGELVLHPFLGARFKSVVVTTDLPLEVDRPIDFGLQDFCRKCLKCARECPVSAISVGEPVMFNGYEQWKQDVQRCTLYRMTNPGGAACGRCMKMCPYNTEGLARDRRWLWAAMHLPWARGFLAVLDDWLGHGRQNPAKQWWFDLEVVDGRTVPARGTNVRGLNRRLRVPTDDQKIAHYPADLNPAPDDPGPTPLDRREGLRRAREAPRPPGAG